MSNIHELTKYNMVYLASPYSKYPTGQENAFVEIAAIAGKLLLHGVRFYSPICHTHPIARYGNIDPLDHKIWLPFDEAIMGVCDALVVAKMPTWGKSYGIGHEMGVFQKAGKPVYFLDPEKMELS